MTPSDVFISYATQDFEFVSQLHQRLTEQDFSAWFDEDNDNFDLSHRAETHKYIQNCRAFLLIQSPASLTSVKVREELSRAINNEAKPVIVLDWQPAVKIPRSMQSLLLQANQRLDFDGEISAESVNKLISALRRFIPVQAESNQSKTTVPVRSNRRLSGLPQEPSSRKDSPTNPNVFGAQIISNIVIRLDLPPEAQDAIGQEIKWLFSAVDHLLKFKRGEVERNQPVAEPVPATAHSSPASNNLLLDTLSDADFEALSFFYESSTPLTELEVPLKNLKILREQETARGEAGKGDPQLQDQLQTVQITAAKTVQKIAHEINKAYGILVTAPTQMIEMLEEHLNPITLGSMVISQVITPLDLPPNDHDFVEGEVKWLFSAANTYRQAYYAVQQELIDRKAALVADGLSSSRISTELSQLLPEIRQSVLDHSQPPAIDIPPDAEKSPAATNRILKILDDNDLSSYFRISARIIAKPEKELNVSSLLNQITAKLQNLDTLLRRETQMGEAGKQNVELQNEIQHNQMSVIKVLQKLTQHMDEAYGILVTTPDQLVEAWEAKS